MRTPALLAVATVLALAGRAYGGAFIFAGESYGVDLITHPKGYFGSGGTVQVSLCIDPDSPNALEMVAPVQRALAKFNALAPTTGNLKLGASNDIPSGMIDFESIALHEIGHCIGLAHPNAATESGLSGSSRNYTKATNGVNDVFDLDPGMDGIIGSDDDVRGDDVNLHWFLRATNNPFEMATTVDLSTYSRDVADLPASHLFAANADRTLAIALGVPNTEAVMQQGAFSDEDQRDLGHDDVATLRLGMAGLDEVQGTNDDYDVRLVYVGLEASCDLVLDFDDDRVSFAACFTGGSFLSSTHARITSASISFHTGYNWHYTGPAPQSPPGCPSAPDPGCVTGFARASLRLDDATAGREKVAAHWKKGPMVAASSFGDPTVYPGTTFAMCVYDDADLLVGTYDVPRAASVCSRRECWKGLGAKGFRYSDPARASDGVRLMRLLAGEAGRSKVTVLAANHAAKGHAGLPTGVAAALAGSTSATIQLFGSDSPDCFSAGLSDVVRNDGVAFVAR